MQCIFIFIIKRFEVDFLFNHLIRQFLTIIHKKIKTAKVNLITKYCIKNKKLFWKCYII
jgi:hypothetical protein